MASHFAQYAIPGLMPPTRPYYDERVFCLEDGSIKKLIYTGDKDSVVTYAISLPGWHHGIVKDPSYAFLDNEKPIDVDTYPNYLIKDIISDTEATWTLVLPAGILPEGTSTLQICANGSVKNYYITRQQFYIHYQPDVTTRKPFNYQNPDIN